MTRYSQETEDQIWATAVRLGRFTYAQLAAATNRPKQGVSRTVLDWEKAGRVERIVTEGNCLRFRITDREAGEVPAPRQQSREGNMWNAMRHFPSFKPTDLAALATTEIVNVSIDEASAFCRMLAGAGYLRVLDKAVPGRREATYRLVRDTGPLPPRQMRVTVVFDANLRAVTHMPQEVA